MLILITLLVKYDDTITLGNVVAAISFMVGAISVIARVTKSYAESESRLARIESKLNVIYEWWTHQVDEATSIRTKMFHGEINSNPSKGTGD